MEAVDDRTLVIYWKQPYILVDYFSPDMLPAHILESTFRENDQALATSPWLSTEYVGNGPFKLKEFIPSAYVTLTAFDSYVLGRPRLDEVQVKFIPDGNTMLANILSGAADLTLSSTPSVEQSVELQQQSWDGQIGDFSMNYIHFFVQYIDPVHPVLTDKRFHKALMFALDRQAYVDTIQHGYGGVAEVPLLPSDPNFNAILSHVDRYPFDPRRAAEMFAQVDLARGSDGFLRFTGTGQRLEEIEFRTTAEQDVQVRLLAAMSDNFKDAGLDIKQVAIPQNRTADRLYRVTNPGLEELSGGLGPASLIGFMHSSKVPGPQNNYTNGNYPRYSNPQWDAMIDRYAVTIPLDQRLQIMTDIIKWLQDNLMDVGVIYSTHPQFAARRLIVQQDHALWAPETWDLK
jgi:peptide/nickel transport system substrate-binding protein